MKSRRYIEIHISEYGNIKNAVRKGKITLFKILYFLIRYVAPLAIIVIFITNLLM